MAAGAAALLVVAAAAAAVALTVLPSHGSPVSRAAGAPAATSSRAASLVPTAAATTPAAKPAPRASASPVPKASTAPAAGALPGAQAGQYSPDAGLATRDNPAGVNFGARARGRGMPDGRWPGRRGGSPRYGGTGVFTGAFFRPAPRGGPGMFGR